MKRIIIELQQVYRRVLIIFMTFLIIDMFLLLTSSVIGYDWLLFFVAITLFVGLIGYYLEVTIERWKQY